MSLRTTERVELVIDISSDDENTPAFAIGGRSFGSLKLPGTITGTSLDIQVTNDEDSSGAPQNWTNLVDDTNVAVGTLTVAADDQFPLPSEAFHFKYVRFQMDAQGADRTLILFVID